MWLAAVAAPAQAANVTWTGVSGATWTTGTNWSGGSAPTSADDVFLTTVNRNLALLNNSNVTINTLTILSATNTITGTGGTGNRSIGSTLTINNGLTYSTNNATPGVFTRVDTIALGNSQIWNVGGATSTNPQSGAPGPQFIGTGSTVMAFNLNGNTLTKSGTGMLSIGGATIGNGDIDVSQGALRIAVSSFLPVSVTGSGTVSVQAGASLFLAATTSGAGSGAEFTFTKPIVMLGSGSAATISFGSTSTNNTAGSQTIASNIEWNGVSELQSWVQSANVLQNWTFSGNFTGDGTIRISTLTSSATSSALRLSGSNSGFTGVVDNRVSTGSLNRPVVFVGANAGSENAEWRVGDYRARYWLDGSSVQLGALSSDGSVTAGGTTALLGNFSATTSATATIGGKGIDTVYAGLLVDGSAASLAVTKVGAGTLTLSNTNTYTGLTDVQGGRILYGVNDVLGSGAVRVSGGTLDIATFNDTVGAVTLTSGTIAGSTGVLTGASYDVRGGAVSAILGGSGIALTKSTAGTVTLTGVNTYSGATAVNAGVLAVNGSIAASSGLSVASGATVAGSGVVAALSGAGLVSPGSSPGILTAPSIDPSTGMDFAFEFTSVGSPSYGSPTASVNDVLRLTGAIPSLAALDGDNIVSIYFDDSIAADDVFRGGTYIDVATTPEDRDAFAAAIAGADWRYYVYGDGGGTNLFNGKSYYTLFEYDPTLSIERSVVASEANFGAGTISGAITQFTVVPEPGTVCLLGIAGLAMAARLRVSGRRIAMGGVAPSRRR